MNVIPERSCALIHIFTFLLQKYDVIFQGFIKEGGRRGRDRMDVGFTTTCAISALSSLQL